MIYSIDSKEFTSISYFSSIVLSYILLHSFLKPSVKSISLNYEDKQLKASIRQKFSSKKIPEDIDTIIIGSGMAGLSCAAILSRLGKRVLVLEQHNDVAGGGTHQFDLQGYRFDSGLHYTVPWSVPIFALTTGKKESDVCQFDLTGDENGTADRVYLHNIDESKHIAEPFDMKYKETHIPKIYSDYPNDKKCIDEFMKLSDDAMLFVKIFIGFRLFPKWLQNILWKIVPKRVLDVVSQTAEELLAKYTNNKKLISLLSSMWIDTGARPDEATFMLTASVFRGISMEGGCYPRDGAESMAIELANTIQSNGGNILIRALVEEIVYDESGNKLTGVRVKRSKPNSQPNTFQNIIKKSNDEERVFIPCKRVVSACGYSATFDRIVPERILNKYNMPRRLGVSQSAGFVMANVGFKDINAESINLPNLNTWHIPVNKQGDHFEPMKAFFATPLTNDENDYLNIPTFITFPSLKDKAWSKSHPNKISCQMLIMADYRWFEHYQNEINEAIKAKDENRWKQCITDYVTYKEQWKLRCQRILYHYYPVLESHVDFFDISTPLAIENYLFADKGSAVGIDVTPTRFIDPVIREYLDPVTPCPQLYLTGQDTVLCGVTLCQLSGVITAFRMEGLFASLKILKEAIVAGL